MTTLPELIRPAWMARKLSTPAHAVHRSVMLRMLRSAGALTRIGNRPYTTPDLLAEHAPALLTALHRAVATGTSVPAKALGDADECESCDALRARLLERDRQLAELATRLANAEAARKR